MLRSGSRPKRPLTPGLRTPRIWWRNRRLGLALGRGQSIEEAVRDIGQVVECLEAINGALARIRRDPSALFCGFDNQGHCLIAPETQRSVAALWQTVLASQRAAGGKGRLATTAA